MKHFAALLLFAAAPALAAPPAGFADRVEKLRTEAGIPGMSVAIVEQGKPVMAQGFGVRKLGTTDKVDAHTIFQTGSTGKALTAAALAQRRRGRPSSGSSESRDGASPGAPPRGNNGQ